MKRCLRRCACFMLMPAEERLAMGKRYLLALDYEQAVVHFLAAIEIDPMNPRGYADAAEAYIANGQTEAAIALLLPGAERTGDAALTAWLAELMRAVQPEEPEVPQSEPLSRFGETPFATRPNFIPYDALTDSRKELLEGLANALIAEDTDTFFDLAITQDGREVFDTNTSVTTWANISLKYTPHRKSFVWSFACEMGWGI